MATVNDIKKLVDKCFNEDRGFGKYKNVATQLLKDTTKILDEFGIDYFLISGTLLGYTRHNDFIPWDDDMDLIVDPKIFTMTSRISRKYSNIQFVKIESCDWLIKICYKKGVEPEEKCELPWTWPFIDLFTYSYDSDKKNINFFNKKWDVTKFFPPQKVSFLNINVKIPNDPKYFLTINYGINYMTVLKSSPYCHRYEKHIDNCIEIHIKK